MPSSMPMMHDDPNEMGQEKRNALIRNVAALFVISANNCDDDQLEIYDSVLLRLADMVELEARQYVAEKLAPLSLAPENTVRKLVHDDINVAKPLILQSSVLTEKDLITITQTLGIEHIRVLAERPALNERITDCIAIHDDDHTHYNLAANISAHLSAQTVLHLARKAENDETLLNNLSSRTDLTEEAIDVIVSFASETIKTRLLKMGCQEEATRIDDAKEIARARLTNEYWLSQYNFKTAYRTIHILHRKGDLDEQLLCQLARSNRFAEMTSAFAILTSTLLEDAKYLLVRTNTKLFIIICRAKGFQRATVEHMLHSDPWKERLNDDIRHEALKHFDDLDQTSAKRMFQFWQSQRTVH